MILNVSGRTDIVAFYTDWFMNRYHEGFVDVRNPFNPKLVSRIDFSDVDAILFCTKNPIPILNKINEINKPIIFHVTLTPYKKDIEPNVPPKGEIVEAVKKLSKIIGKDNLVIRYDPVFISAKYTLDYHIRAFENLCSLLDGYVSKILISFLDDYKNVRKNEKVLNFKELEESEFWYCPNGKIPKFDFKAIDNYDGNITSKVKEVIKNGNIVFTVTDSSGNQTNLSKSAVEKDTEKPAIKLNGEEDVRLVVGEKYEEMGATAIDYCDGDLTDQIEISG